MLPLILAALAAPPLPPAVPPSAGAVLLRREVYEVESQGRRVKIGIDEWSEKSNPRR